MEVVTDSVRYQDIECSEYSTVHWDIALLIMTNLISHIWREVSQAIFTLSKVQTALPPISRHLIETQKMYVLAETNEGVTLNMLNYQKIQKDIKYWLVMSIWKVPCRQYFHVLEHFQISRPTLSMDVFLLDIRCIIFFINYLLTIDHVK